MRESDEFYARPNETYEQYVHRKARKALLFMRFLQAGESKKDAVDDGMKEDKE